MVTHIPVMKIRWNCTVSSFFFITYCFFFFFLNVFPFPSSFPSPIKKLWFLSTPNYFFEKVTNVINDFNSHMNCKPYKYDEDNRLILPHSKKQTNSGVFNTINTPLTLSLSLSLNVTVAWHSRVILTPVLLTPRGINPKRICFSCHCALNVMSLEHSQQTGSCFQCS